MVPRLDSDALWQSFLSKGVFLSYRKLRFHTIKMLREDAHSAQGQMVAEATAPRRENVPRHILFHSQDS